MELKLKKIFTGMEKGPEAINDNFNNLLDSFNDTGIVTKGINFNNGAYDWGTKQGLAQYSYYRVVTIGDVDIVTISLDLARNKDTSSSVVFGSIPASAALKGTNNFAASPNGVQFRFDNNTFRIAPTGKLLADTRIQLRTSYIVDHV